MFPSRTFKYVGKQCETFFSNWIEHNMCGDYNLMNKWTHLDKHAMPLSKEIFDALGQAKVFNTLDWSMATINCHWRKVIRSKQHFGELIIIGRIVCINWSFCHFVWKMLLESLKRSWIKKILACIDFSKSYVDNIIVFSLTLGRHMHHL